MPLRFNCSDKRNWFCDKTTFSTTTTLELSLTKNYGLGKPCIGLQLMYPPEPKIGRPRDGGLRHNEWRKCPNSGIFGA